MQEITKKDWESLKAMAEAQEKQSLISQIQFSALKKLAEEKIAEFEEIEEIDENLEALADEED